MPLVPYSNRAKYPVPTSGGKGSFSYADTRVYVPGAEAMYWMRQLWSFNSATGAIVDQGKRIWVPPGASLDSFQRIIPGQGGGAKLPGKRVRGGSMIPVAASTVLGAGPGPNPNGMVLIRLMRIG